MSSVIVTGATGYIARHTVTQLLAHGLSYRDLILVTRTPDALADAAEQGARVRHADFREPEGLPSAFAGGERIFLIAPAPESFGTTAEQLDAQKAAITAAASAGVRHAVLQSRLTAHERLGGYDTEAADTEAALRDSGMAWTILRTAGFADSRGRTAKRSVREGRIVTNTDVEACSRFVTRDDIAAAAAVVLTTPGHADHVYHLLGPVVSTKEIADVLGELSGAPMHVVQLDDAAYTKELIERGSPPRIAELAAAAGKQSRELSLRLACDLPTLLDRDGQSLLDFLRANREELVTGTPPSGREPVLT